jgi:hypothetical protein
LPTSENVAVDPAAVRAAFTGGLLGTRYGAHDASPLLRVLSRIIQPIFTVTDFEGGRRFTVGLSRGASHISAVYALTSATQRSTKVASLSYRPREAHGWDAAFGVRDQSISIGQSGRGERICPVMSDVPTTVHFVGSRSTSSQAQTA